MQSYISMVNLHMTWYHFCIPRGNTYTTMKIVLISQSGLLSRDRTSLLHMVRKQIAGTGSFAGYKNYLHSVFFKITQKRLQIKHKVWGIEKKTVVVLVACCMFSQVYTFDLGAELKGISFSSVRMQRYSPITAIRAIQTVLTSHHVNVAGKWEL